MEMDKLLGFMRGEPQEPEAQDSEDNSDKKPKKSFVDQVKDAFPSDEELQNTRRERKEWLGNNVVGKLKDAGYPTAANYADKASDFLVNLTPETREDYMNGLAVPAVGSIEKVGANAASKTLTAPAKMAVSQEGKSALSKLARSMPSAESAALEGSENQLGGLVNKLADEGTYVKQGQLKKAADINNIKLRNEVRSNPSPGEALDYKQINNASSNPPAKDAINYKQISPGEVTPGVKDLQLDMQVAQEMGDYKKAKAIQEQIRALRGGR